MKGIFKKNRAEGTPAQQVATLLEQMGYEIEAYGEEVAQQLLDMGHNPAEIASQFVYTTMAYDLHHAGTTATASLRYRPVATGVLAVLDRFRDEGLLSEARYKHDYELMVSINAINASQLACIEAVLAEPLLGAGRLASNNGKVS